MKDLTSAAKSARFGLILLLSLIVSGAGQVLPQGAVGDGGWELERVLGRGSADHISISPDGNTLAVAGSRGVSLLSLPRLEDVGTLAAERWIASTHWSPDGTRLATVSHGGLNLRLEGVPEGNGGYHHSLSERNPRSVQVWDVAGRQLLTDLEYSAATDALAWSPAGDILIGTGDTAGGREADGTLRLWDAATGKTRSQLTGSDGRSQAIAYSPDGKSIASIGESRKLSLWDASSGALRFAPLLPFAGDYLSWSHGSAWLTLGDRQGVLNFLDPRRGLVLHRFSVVGGDIHALAWSPTDSTLAIGTENAVEVLFWKADELVDRIVLFRKAPVTSIAWSADGRYVAAADENNIVRVRGFSSGYPTDVGPDLKYDSRVLELAWTPECCTLVTRGENGAVQVRDVHTGDTLGQGTDFAAPGDTEVRSGYVYLTWSPDGERVFAGRKPESWPEEQHIFPDGRSWNVADGRRVVEDRWLNESLPFPDGARLAITRGDSVTIQDIETGAGLFHLEHDAPVRSVHWSGDGSRLAVTLAPGAEGDLPRLQIWELGNSATPIAEFTTSQWGAKTLAWSPNGRYLANSVGFVVDGSLDSFIRIFDVDNNRLVANLETNDFADSLAWSSNGRHLAGAGFYALSLREVNIDESSFDARWWTKMSGVDGPASDVAWSPDGQLLATASRSRSRHFSSTHPALVTIFDANTGERLAHLEGHTGDVKRVVWSPDGTRLASTGQDATVRIWRRPDDA
ncbi:MAG: WD40 repeat domain-containing protein [Anaerolineaceae bacterium]|nr:WD40 repeat domain-containing protein [Anaerolineaceae bacterium]